MPKVFLLLGGNQGQRLQLIENACSMIEERTGKIIIKSSLYESEAWGFEAEKNFLNQVIIIESSKSPHQVLQEVLEMELELGRQRSGKGYSSRTMDIDVLFYDDQIIDTEDLIIPHPRMHLRRFTMEPLIEIAPEFIHPKFNKTLETLLLACSDNSQVKIYKE